MPANNNFNDSLPEPHQEFDDSEESLNSTLHYLLAELTALENDFMEIEKHFFEMHPSLTSMIERAAELRQVVDSQGLHLAARRIRNLKMTLQHFQKNHGYNLDNFHRVFLSLRTAITKAPQEVLPTPWQQRLSGRVEEAAGWIKGLSDGDGNYERYILVRCSDLRFLIRGEKVLWKKRVPNKDKWKIQIKHLEEPNVFVFKNLLSKDLYEAVPQELLAVLIQTPSGEKGGVLVDELEGEIALSKKLLKKKTEYFRHGENRYEPYVQMRGMRYFLRYPSEE